MTFDQKIGSETSAQVRSEFVPLSEAQLEIIRFLEHDLAEKRTLYGDGDPIISSAMRDLASCYDAMGRKDEAEELILALSCFQLETDSVE